MSGGEIHGSSAARRQTDKHTTTQEAQLNQTPRTRAAAESKEGEVEGAANAGCDKGSGVFEGRERRRER